MVFSRLSLKIVLSSDSSACLELLRARLRRELLENTTINRQLNSWLSCRASKRSQSRTFTLRLSRQLVGGCGSFVEPLINNLNYCNEAQLVCTRNIYIFCQFSFYWKVASSLVTPKLPPPKITESKINFQFRPNGVWKQLKPISHNEKTHNENINSLLLFPPLPSTSP